MLVNGKGKHILTDERYSQAKGRVVDYFLDENRNKTLDSKLHVHVIHDERKDEVRLHITDRRGGDRAEQPHKLTLSRPSGNEVNAAEARLAAILRQMKAEEK